MDEKDNKEDGTGDDDLMGLFRNADAIEQIRPIATTFAAFYHALTSEGMDSKVAVELTKEYMRIVIGMAQAQKRGGT